MSKAACFRIWIEQSGSRKRYWKSNSAPSLKRQNQQVGRRATPAPPAQHSSCAPAREPPLSSCCVAAMSHARIFGDETGQRGPSAIRDNINKSSIPGGIFGSDPLPRRPPSNITASSVEGGIFKQPAAVPTPNPPTRQQHTPRDTMQETLTGIGGWARDDSTTTRLDPNVHPIAGGRTFTSHRIRILAPLSPPA